MKFIDEARIYVKSGDGGKGHVSFRKEKFVAMGGPDGGNGGKGGDVIFRVNKQLSTLLDLRYVREYIAEDGLPGSKKRCTGKHGKNKVIKVPKGTVIRDADSDRIIADLADDDVKFVVAKGGIGGKGNAEFTTPTNQAPRYAQPGRPGKELNLVIELKLLADVGLVGYPNVGKSTLISVISAAKPKIADYPFTTLTPNLGIVRIGEYENYTVADIPGLIEGASDGKGLGITFLKHVERTDVLVFLIDANSEDPVNDYDVLRNELVSYNPDMDYKHKILCFSKCDSVLEDRLEELKLLEFNGINQSPLFISAVTHSNIDRLKTTIWNHLVKVRTIANEV